MDGLKTGYTKNALYCLTSTAKKNNLRLISVVMGESDSKIRNEETSNILDYGFSNYKTKTLLKKNSKVYEYKNDKISLVRAPIINKEEVNVLTKNNSKDKFDYKVVIDKIKIPTKKNKSVGKIIVYKNKKKLYSVPLYFKKDIKKANIFKLFINNLINFMSFNF